MKHLYLLIGVAAAVGCTPAPGKNPAELWIGLNGSEKAIKLVDKQPNPF
jgi:hypothetical protein